MEKDLNSLHNNAQRAYVDLMNYAQHIEVSLHRQTTQQILANRLRLKTSIDVVRWLSFQGCAFKGHDESSRSKNRGNFLELLLLLASYDEKVEDILKSALQNASYTSSTIQKEILQIHANRVRNVIREEIGDRKFSIIVDEARDESKKEQMTIILRFIDKQGQVKERFFDIVHVKDTASLTLKNVIFNVLLQHSFDIQNIRALVAAAREVVEVHQFFKDLSDIVNSASASSKRHDELQKAQAAEITHMNAQYIVGRSRNKKEDVIVEHHYQVDIFFATIDTQLQELKSRFNENVVELLTLTTALDPKEFFKSLVESGKSVMYPLVDRLIRLILTLPVSTASSEHTFSAMKIVKTRLRSKMEDDFLRSSLVVYIEKEIVEKFDINEIIFL
ncbi:uncharacterized protein LOC105772033 [Gossypium raimondii]|uniref:uncharacterized protein LOC105772033 n=1 Tax=Gossypium raimondii TaxID=29730 RepID=UPI00063ADF40|nr:uncharacterized protein LOC105772033 [Gossypium raimondii]